MPTKHAALRGRYRAVYCAPAGCLHGDIVTYTDSEPTAEKSFKVPLDGLVVFSLYTHTDTHPNTEEEAPIMAKTKKANDELAELEELEGLEDLEADEPEATDEAEVEEAPKPKRSRSRKAKAKPAAEEVEEEDDEEDGEKPKTLKELRAEARALKLPGVSKMSRDELVAAIAAGPAEVDEGEEEDDEPVKETAAAKKKRLAAEKKAAAAKPAAKKAADKPAAKADDGSVGTADIAEEVGITGRQVRIFLRNNAEEFPKPDGHRYRWPSLVNKDAKKLIKRLEKEFAED